MTFFHWGLQPEDQLPNPGLATAITSVIAVDETCAGCSISVTSAPGYIILEGIVPTKVALRAKEIAREVAGNRQVLDRMFWKDC